MTMTEDLLQTSRFLADAASGRCLEGPKHKPLTPSRSPDLACDELFKDSDEGSTLPELADEEERSGPTAKYSRDSIHQSFAGL